jgi:hypothetical protein
MGLEKAVWLAKLQNVKCTVLLLFVLNGTVFGLALWLVSIQNSWPERVLVVMGILVVVSGLRVFWLGAMGFAQVAVASVMITAQQDKDAQAAAAADDDDDDDAATQDDSLTQRDRRVWISSFSIYTHFFTKLLGLVALLTSFCSPFSNIHTYCVSIFCKPLFSTGRPVEELSYEVLSSFGLLIQCHVSHLEDQISLEGKSMSYLWKKPTMILGQ